MSSRKLTCTSWLWAFLAGGKKGLVCLLKAFSEPTIKEAHRAWQHGHKLFQNLCFLTDVRSSSASTPRAQEPWGGWPSQHRESFRSHGRHILLSVTRGMLGLGWRLRAQGLLPFSEMSQPLSRGQPPGCKSAMSLSMLSASC